LARVSEAGPYRVEAVRGDEVFMELEPHRAVGAEIVGQVSVLTGVHPAGALS
jgi:hypothetical protein